MDPRVCGVSALLKRHARCDAVTHNEALEAGGRATASSAAARHEGALQTGAARWNETKRSLKLPTTQKERGKLWR
jgi:hypothetical protein